jgi:hypothetical protein
LTEHRAPATSGEEPSPWITLPEPRGVAIRLADKSGYTSPCGRRLPGVTTILGATSEGKERLQQWLKRPDAQSISDAAKARGTWTHNAIEAWIAARTAGEQPPDARHFAFGGYWRSMRPWLESHWTHAVAIEKPVYHPSGFAGSFDALGYVAYGYNPEQLTLLDWKTSKKKRDAGLVEDYFCQLGAYAQGIHHVYDIRPQRAVLVIARPAGPPDVWELSGDELAEATCRFKKRLATYYSMPSEP